MGGAEERGFRVQADPDVDLPQELGITALLDEARGTPPSAARGGSWGRSRRPDRSLRAPRAQGQVARLGPVDRGEEFDRGDADRVGAAQPQVGDRGVRVADGSRSAISGDSLLSPWSRKNW